MNTTMSANWYDVLDVDPTASADEIRAAWRSAVTDLDPTDRRFRVYNQAAEVLLDPGRRASYDAELERGRSDEAKPRRNDRSETGAAQAAAEGAIVPLLSYDAHHLDESAAAAQPYMTSAEKAEYDKLFAVIRQNAPRTGTVVQAKYLASGIVRSGTDRVDVFVLVNQVTRNKQHPKVPVVYKNQVTVSMAKVGGQWLVDGLTTNGDHS